MDFMGQVGHMDREIIASFQCPVNRVVNIGEVNRRKGSVVDVLGRGGGSDDGAGGLLLVNYSSN